MSITASLAEIPRLLEAGMVLLSFLLLARRRLRPLVLGLAAQGLLLALTMLAWGWQRGDASLWFAALLALAGPAVLLPWLLLRLGRRMHWPDLPAGPLGPRLLMGAVLVLLAALVVPASMPRVDLVPALAVVLLGLWLMLVHRHDLGPAAALLSVTHGISLAGLGVAGMPMPALQLAASALVLAMLGGPWLLRAAPPPDTAE